MDLLGIASTSCRHLGGKKNIAVLGLFNVILESMCINYAYITALCHQMKLRAQKREKLMSTVVDNMHERGTLRRLEQRFSVFKN